MGPWYSVPACKEINLLLLGKSGHGKSSTGNSILGRPAFTKSDGAASQTRTVTLHCSDREDGTRVRVVDTPGVMNTEKPNDQTLAKICEAMSLCPNGFNALILVIKFGFRYTKEEKDSLNVLKKYFGSTFLKNFGIVVMTQGESFDLNYEKGEITFNDWLKKSDKDEQDEEFAKLLQECNNRCVLFYNCGKNYDSKRKECVDNLLKLIKDQITNPYKTEHFQLAKFRRENVRTTLGHLILCLPVQEQLSLLIERIQRDIQNKTFSYQDTRKKLDTLDKEVDSISGHLKEFKDDLKGKIASFRRKAELIDAAKDGQEKIVLQLEMLRDLEILKVTPENNNDDLGNVFLDYASGLKSNNKLQACCLF